MQDDVFFRVNAQKFNIHIRNKVHTYDLLYLLSLTPMGPSVKQLIESAARERFNDGAALVMRAALKATESKQKSVADVRSGPCTLHPLTSPIHLHH